MKTFSRRKPLGCLSLSAFLTALVTLLGVVWFGLAHGGSLFSPGRLNAETGLASLGGVDSHAAVRPCSGCHSAPWDRQTMADRCLACHTDLEQDPHNFHKVMLAQAARPGSCRQCHTEHHGPTGNLTVFDPQGFPHRGVGFSLLAHQISADGSPFACAGCHTHGYTRFDPAVCAACHLTMDAAFIPAHMELYGPDCAACHDGLESYGRAFNHQQTLFPLTGQHASLDCAGCHTGAHSLSALKAAPQSCVACHARDDAHSGSLGPACAACHTSAGWIPAQVDHAKTAFPLAGKHQLAACQACHTLNGRAGVFKGIPTGCVACHARADVHQGDLGQDCAHCHTPSGWQPASIDHALTAFSLTGKHTVAACAACHANNTFKGTPKTCFACHAIDIQKKNWT